MEKTKKKVWCCSSATKDLTNGVWVPAPGSGYALFHIMMVDKQGYIYYIDYDDPSIRYYVTIRPGGNGVYSPSTDANKAVWYEKHQIKGTTLYYKGNQKKGITRSSKPDLFPNGGVYNGIYYDKVSNS